jgi:hypothetical protein
VPSGALPSAPFAGIIGELFGVIYILLSIFLVFLEKTIKTRNWNI